MTRERAHLLGRCLFVAFAIFLPCRHLLPIGGSFYVDWYNHEWVIGYVGQYVRANHAVPSVLNTTTIGGLSAPVFYGNLFYPVLGVPSALLAPGVVIRLAAIAMFVTQYWLVLRALLRIDAPRYLAHAVAALVIWETYPLTNFYNRGALTEFFATTLLVCALAALVLLFHATERRERRRNAAVAMFALTLAAGSHPITAMYGGPVFAALIPVFWWLLRADRARRISIVKSLAPWVALAGICVLPWYLAAHKYAEDVLVRKTAADATVLPGLDDWQTRFFPIPHDPRVVDNTVLETVGTPYLDAQISVSLLIVFLVLGGFAIAALRRTSAPAAVFAISTAFFVFFTWLSLSTAGYHLLPAIAVMIQYCYRAVTYENLSLLLGVFLILMALRSAPELLAKLRHPVVMIVIVAATALGGIGVIVKWGHIAAVKSDRSSPHIILGSKERREMIDLPKTYYGVYDYATDKLFQQAVPDEHNSEVLAQNFPIDATKSFGRTKLLRVKLPEPTWVMTNILSFPWSRLSIDGRAIDEGDVRTHFGKLTVMVPSGEHTLSMKFRPPLLWRILRTVSLVAIFAWALYLLVPFAACIARLKRAS